MQESLHIQSLHYLGDKEVFVLHGMGEHGTVWNMLKAPPPPRYVSLLSATDAKIILL